MIEKRQSDIRHDFPANQSRERESDRPRRAGKHALCRLHQANLLIVVALASLAGDVARAGDKDVVKFLSTAIKQDGTITCSVRPGVDPLLPFIKSRTTETLSALELTVTTFVGEQGDNLSVTPSILELPGSTPQDRCVIPSFDQPFLTLRLKVPELPAAGKYTGFLVVAQKGQMLQTHTIELVQAPVKPIVRLLQAPAGPETTITCCVRPDVDLLLPFERIQATEKLPPLEFLVTAFISEQGDSLSITPSILELPDSKPQGPRVAFSFPSDKSIMSLKLKVPELPTPSKYKGNLLVVREGQVVQKQPIELTRATVPRPAQLTTDLKAITIRYTKTWVPGLRLLHRPEASPSFTMLVRNPNTEWQAKGVFLRLLEVTTPERVNFDPEKSLTLSWNGQKPADLWRSPLPDSTGALPHAIAPNQQAQIGGAFHDLGPGEYTIKLGVAAGNVAAESEQQVTVKVQVRHSVVWAIVVLVVAIFVSFIATKGLDAQRRRRDLLKKIADLRPAWLRDELATAPVVSVQAILKQAVRRNKNWWTALFGPEVVSDRVNKAGLMLGLLRQAHEIREQIRIWEQPPMPKYRAEQRLQGITALLDPETVNEKVAGEVQDKLNELKKWFDSNALPDSYWSDVRLRIESLQPQAIPENFPDPRQRTVVTDLRQQIEQELAAKDPKVDETYARLKILWECRRNDNQEALEQLVPLLEARPYPGLDDFFKQRDDIAWRHLQDACKTPDGLRFTSPRKSTMYPLEAYEILSFEVGPADRRLGNNFLFKHGLEYHWSLDLETRRWWRLWTKRTEKLTERVTREPQLVESVPSRGKLLVSVTLCYSRDTCAPEVRMSEPLTIARSGDFSWMSSFQFVEAAALIIATVFALVSGLATYYVGKGSFGSMGDYLALFIWGAGVDQTKNFLQHLTQSSGAKNPSS